MILDNLLLTSERGVWWFKVDHRILSTYSWKTYNLTLVQNVWSAGLKRSWWCPPPNAPSHRSSPVLLQSHGVGGMCVSSGAIAWHPLPLCRGPEINHDKVFLDQSVQFHGASALCAFAPLQTPQVLRSAPTTSLKNFTNSFVVTFDTFVVTVTFVR